MTIIVTPTLSGSYTNTVTVSDAVEIDTNPASTVTTTVLASPRPTSP